MGGEILDWLLEKFHFNSKKGIENLVVFLILLVIVMVMMNSIFSKEKTTSESIPVVSKVETEEISFERKLERILSTINGVNNVSVLIAYEDTVEKVPLYDTKEITTITEEVDQNGGERKTKEVNNEYAIAYEENGSQKIALMKQNILPKMMGVIVTAEGVSSSTVKESIIRAVIAVTGLSSNKIQVFEK